MRLKIVDFSNLSSLTHFNLHEIHVLFERIEIARYIVDKVNDLVNIDCSKYLKN